MREQEHPPRSAMRLPLLLLAGLGAAAAFAGATVDPEGESEAVTPGVASATRWFHRGPAPIGNGSSPSMLVSLNRSTPWAFHSWYYPVVAPGLHPQQELVLLSSRFVGGDHWHAVRGDNGFILEPRLIMNGGVPKNGTVAPHNPGVLRLEVGMIIDNKRATLTLQTEAALPALAWSHVALTYAADARLRVFVNGTLAGTLEYINEQLRGAAHGSRLATLPPGQRVVDLVATPAKAMLPPLVNRDPSLAPLELVLGHLLQGSAFVGMTQHAGITMETSKSPREYPLFDSEQLVQAIMLQHVPLEVPSAVLDAFGLRRRTEEKTEEPPLMQRLVLDADWNPDAAGGKAVFRNASVYRNVHLEVLAEEALFTEEVLELLRRVTTAPPPGTASLPREPFAIQVLIGDVTLFLENLYDELVFLRLRASRRKEAMKYEEEYKKPLAPYAMENLPNHPSLDRAASYIDEIWKAFELQPPNQSLVKRALKLPPAPERSKKSNEPQLSQVEASRLKNTMDELLYQELAQLHGEPLEPKHSSIFCTRRARPKITDEERMSCSDTETLGWYWMSGKGLRSPYAAYRALFVARSLLAAAKWAALSPPSRAFAWEERLGTAIGEGEGGLADLIGSWPWGDDRVPVHPVGGWSFQAPRMQRGTVRTQHSRRRTKYEAQRAQAEKAKSEFEVAQAAERRAQAEAGADEAGGSEEPTNPDPNSNPDATPDANSNLDPNPNPNPNPKTNPNSNPNPDPNRGIPPTMPTPPPLLVDTMTKHDKQRKKLEDMASDVRGTLPRWHVAAPFADPEGAPLPFHDWSLSQQLLLSQVLALLAFGVASWALVADPLSRDANSTQELQVVVHEVLNLLGQRAVTGWTGLGLQAAQQDAFGARVDDLFETLNDDDGAFWRDAVHEIVAESGVDLAAEAATCAALPPFLGQSANPDLIPEEHNHYRPPGDDGMPRPGAAPPAEVWVLDLIKPPEERTRQARAMPVNGYRGRVHTFSQVTPTATWSGNDAMVLPLPPRVGLDAGAASAREDPYGSPTLAELLGHRNTAFFLESSFLSRPGSYAPTGLAPKQRSNPNPNPKPSPQRDSGSAEGGLTKSVHNLAGASCSVSRALLRTPSKYLGDVYARNGTLAAEPLRFATLTESASFTLQHALGIANPHPDPNPNTAEIAFRRARALAGDAHAAFNLGIAYYFGNQGVEANRAEARRLFEMAAEGPAPVPGAYYNLATMVNRAEGGFARDPELAQRYFERAADLGFAPAASGLAAQLMSRGTKEDDERAARLLAMSVSHGNADAALHLGVLFRQGRGVQKSTLLAAKYVAVAAARGQRLAVSLLGQDLSDPTSWLRRMAEQHHKHPLLVERERDISVANAKQWREVLEGPPEDKADPKNASRAPINNRTDPHVIASETTPGAHYVYNPKTGEVGVWVHVPGNEFGFGLSFRDDCTGNLRLLASAMPLAPWQKSELERSADAWTDAGETGDMRDFSDALYHAEAGGLYGSLQGLDNAAYLLSTEFLPPPVAPKLPKSVAASPFALFLASGGGGVDGGSSAAGEDGWRGA
eukprot:CAMPEP_0118863252 /NCGR_PEP_ID=MMETSP1163-20130328/8195_1 /TAXON_ID=124430 /ORGANISM="Phaeomonas parva, Strain CCMP2877" /LENGTH=1548 /DNA_ID=CAMNT_0006797237 /DNA_START=109 /DNA_END=4752 /DNA_ORIENTATION=-